MKNIKKTLFALLLAVGIISSITNAFLIPNSNIQSQSLCEETDLDCDIILCHDNGDRNSGG